MNATPDTGFYPEQRIRYTTITYGEAVYDRKGNIVNSNWPGVKSVYEGVVECVVSEAISRSATVVKCKSTSKKSILTHFNFYPQNINDQYIVEILE